MRKRLYVFLLCTAMACIGGVAEGQNVRLTKAGSRWNVGLDLNYLYNYNIYEHNRWGAGLYAIAPLKYDKRYGSLFQNMFVASAYAGYGTRDKAMKWGASAGLLFNRWQLRSLTVCYQHDLLRVGAHSFDDYKILNTSNNSTYFSSHYCGVDRVASIVQLDPRGPLKLMVEYNHSRERYLFDGSGLLFPADGDDAPLYDYYNEVGMDIELGEHWKFGLLANLRREDPDRNLYNIFPGIHYVRFLTQYSNPIALNDKGAKLSIFAQGGIVFDDVPLSRRFDLGGTGGSRYYFNNTFLTVRPNTFMADAFALANIRYTAGFALWKNEVSNPHPFIQLGAMWGGLYGKDVTGGTKTVTIAHTQQGNPVRIAISCPYDGLLEPGLGIDKLLHWGVLDMGVAAAYQLTKKNSPYHLDNFFDKFAVMVVAELIIK